MNKTAYFTLWGGLFILCAGLGFIPEPEGVLRFLTTTLSLLFFLPPLMLCRNAIKQGDRRTLALLRNLSALSLTLTVVLLIGNFLSLMAPQWLGNVLYGVLVIVSAPMVCSGYWLLSLFLWACLLVVSLEILKKK